MKHSNLLVAVLQRINIPSQVLVNLFTQSELSLQSLSMKFNTKSLLLSALLALPLIVSAPTAQASMLGGFGMKGTTSMGQPHGFAHRSVLLAAGGVSKEDAVKTAKAAFPGKTLQVEKVNHKGKSVFKVKLLSANSRVQIVYVDATTGKITK